MHGEPHEGPKYEDKDKPPPKLVQVKGKGEQPDDTNDWGPPPDDWGEDPGDEMEDHSWAPPPMDSEHQKDLDRHEEELKKELADQAEKEMHGEPHEGPKYEDKDKPPPKLLQVKGKGAQPDDT